MMTTTTIMSLAAFALLAGYLAIMAFRYGVPDMVSDTYYQLSSRSVPAPSQASDTADVVVGASPLRLQQDDQQESINPSSGARTLHTTTDSTTTSSKAKPLLFTLVLLAVVFLVLPCLMESNRGFQPFAFWGCAGLAFVAVSPAYLSADQSTVHKAGAITAATGCVFWCLTATVWPTLIIVTLYALYLTLTSLLKALNGIWYISKPTPPTFHPWYWAEVAAFADVFVTYWAV